MGGWDGSKALNDIYSTDDGTNWVKIVTNGDVFSARSLFGIAVFKEKLYVMGGIGDSKELNDIYSTDDGTNWVKIDTNGDVFSVRAQFGTAVFNGKL